MEGINLLEDYEDEYYGQDYGTEDEDVVWNKLSIEQLGSLYEYCIEPTVSYAYVNLIILLTCCLIYRVVSNVIRTPDSSHILSSVIGIYMLYIYFKFHVIHIVTLVVIGYLVILVLSNLERRRGYVTGFIFITYLVVCEKLLIDSNVWIKIRGPQMIASMKIISVAFDLDSHQVLRISMLEYVGYLLCPGTCVWGPWVSYNQYKTKQHNIDEDKTFIFQGIRSAVYSLFYFTLSTCFIEYFVTPSWSVYWLVYRDALVFRTSHYFVSSISESTTSLSGYKDITVCNPVQIEIPRSLSQVVKHWNLPVHKFLKTYVFKTCHASVGAFTAIMMTYFISALLHGLNIKLAAVLLSLGFYTYVEYSLRLELSQYFSACIGARQCSNSTHCAYHKYTKSNLIVNTTNIILTMVAMLHLAYLGVLMDTSPDSVTQQQNNDYPFQRWHDLYYISHYIVLVNFTINIFFSFFKRILINS